MDAPGWLARQSADVPSGEDWLGAREREVQAGLRVQPRREAWRLGRWTAKSATRAWLGIAPERVEVLAAPDGAPEAWSGARRLPVSLSLSHREGRAMAVVADVRHAVGCDLEVVEPRSDAFIHEWLSAEEQRLVARTPREGRALLVNVLWAAKEAAAKARREGLRLDVRRAVVAVGQVAAPLTGAWSPLRVDWDDGASSTAGWCRADTGWVMAVAGEGAPGRPRAL